MKKHVKKNRNKKGSVLLTVMCFTLVCMLIASTALSLASYSAKVSNKNVRSTQAEISAQDFLQEFLATSKYSDNNYAYLLANAGVNESNPYVITCSFEDNASGANVGTVATSAEIHVYKDSGNEGVVVKSIVNSNGETEIASAFLKGKSRSNYMSTNVIETSDGLHNDVNALNCEGDALIEGIENGLVKFHNTQSNLKGNFVTLQNLVVGDETETTVIDSVNGMAPVIASKGYMFWGKTNMTTTIDKTYENGVAKDGYVLANSYFIAMPASSGTKIGSGYGTTNFKPIDVYCNGAYLGRIPKYNDDGSENTVFTAIKGVYNSATGDYENGIFNNCKSLNESGSVVEITGNFYCNGDLYVYGNNPDDVVINGDVSVSGNIYLISPIKVSGNVYCTGTIYDCSTSDVADAFGHYDKKLNIDSQISTVGGKLNASGLIVGLRTGDGSTAPSYDFLTKKTNDYNEATPNKMFMTDLQHPSDDTVHISSKYASAYKNHGFVGVTDASGATTLTEMDNADLADFIYLDDNFDSSSKTLKQAATEAGKLIKQYIQQNCTQGATFYINCGYNTSFNYLTNGFNFSGSVLDDYFYNVDDRAKYRFEILMPTVNDIVVIMPEVSSQLKVAVRHNYSSSNLNTPVSSSDPDYNPYHVSATPKNFCYFMLDGGADGTDVYGGVTTQYSSTIPSGTSNGAGRIWRLNGTTIYDSGRYTATATEDAIQTLVSSTTISQKACANNNMILVPDECTCEVIQSNNDAWNCRGTLQAILYAPESDVIMNGNGSNQRVLIGQAITRSFDISLNGTQVSTLLPSPGSILKFIDTANPTAGKLELMYYTKYKG